jgi:alkylhydroperoxidase/carboxymuconolactone decarboxylase family protein YurZ
MRQAVEELSLKDIRAEVVRRLDSAEDGESLDDQTAALIAMAVRASVTVLDMDGTREYAREALNLGATPDQLHEALVLVSGLGVHTLMEGTRCLAEVMRLREHPELDAPLDERRARLWGSYVGEDRYWSTFEAEVPGFLDSLLRLSPEAFEAFFIYCAVPWKTGTLPAVTKELISLAADATPSHRYLPGLRLHVGNAVGLGVGRAAILQTLDIAAAAPSHRGVR